MSQEPKFRFQAARPEDSGVIREVVRAAYAKWVPLLGREPMPMKADYEKAVREHRILLAFAGSHLAGLIEMIRQADHLWIENIAVRPERQGAGLGRQLLLLAEQKAREAGVSEIRLLTNGAFEANVSLYQKTGYVIDRREPFMGGITLYMSKKLNG